MSAFELKAILRGSAAAMEDRALSNHVLRIWHIEDDDFETQLLHPESCPVWVGTEPDTFGRVKHYECAVAREIDAVGFDSMFPDGLEDGWWLLMPWFHRTPSTPDGPAEYDAGVEVERIGGPDVGP